MDYEALSQSADGRLLEHRRRELGVTTAPSSAWSRTRENPTAQLPASTIDRTGARLDVSATAWPSEGLIPARRSNRNGRGQQRRHRSGRGRRDRRTGAVRLDLPHGQPEARRTGRRRCRRPLVRRRFLGRQRSRQRPNGPDLEARRHSRRRGTPGSSRRASAPTSPWLPPVHSSSSAEARRSAFKAGVLAADAAIADEAVKHVQTTHEDVEAPFYELEPEEEITETAVLTALDTSVLPEPMPAPEPPPAAAPAPPPPVAAAPTPPPPVTAAPAPPPPVAAAPTPPPPVAAAPAPPPPVAAASAPTPPAAVTPAPAPTAKPPAPVVPAPAAAAAPAPRPPVAAAPTPAEPGPLPPVASAPPPAPPAKPAAPVVPVPPPPAAAAPPPAPAAKPPTPVAPALPPKTAPAAEPVAAPKPPPAPSRPSPPPKPCRLSRFESPRPRRSTARCDPASDLLFVERLMEQSFGLLPHFVLVNLLAGATTGDGSDPLGLAAFVDREATLLGRIKVASRLGKPLGSRTRRRCRRCWKLICGPRGSLTRRRDASREQYCFGYPSANNALQTRGMPTTGPLRDG